MPLGSSIHISISPQDSVAGSRMTGTPAAASRPCSARTPVPGSRSSPSARAGRPRARRPRAIPGRGRRPPRDCRAGRTPGRRPGQHVAVKAAAPVQVAGPQQDPEKSTRADSSPEITQCRPSAGLQRGAYQALPTLCDRPSTMSSAHSAQLGASGRMPAAGSPEPGIVRATARRPGMRRQDKPRICGPPRRACGPAGTSQSPGRH